MYLGDGLNNVLIFLPNNFPQILMLVVYFKSSFLVKRKDLVTENHIGIKLNSYFLLPFYRIPILKNFKILTIVNEILIRIQVRNKLSNKIVWITSWSVYIQIMSCLTDDAKVILIVWMMN